MATIDYEGECCVDCLVYIANGDTPPEMNEEDTVAWLDGIWRRHPTGHLVPTCEEDCEGHFSWRPCDCCGSNLGGDRHPFAVLDAVAS
jgi:hypothetical protein